MQVRYSFHAAALMATIMSILQSTAAAEAPAINQQQDLSNQSFSLTNNSSELSANSNEGRSTQMANPKGVSRREGRMLDLDHLVGDINKDQKAAKDRSLSGQRQSRILSEDISLNPRNRKVQKSSKKKMEIKGFIPIVSLEQAHKDGKNLESSLLGSSGSGDDDDEESDNNKPQDNSQYEQSASQSNTRDQLVSSYGGQTSIGHASFANQAAPEHVANSQWQQVSPQYPDQQAVGRARKLLGSNGILSSLTTPSKRFVSTLVPQATQNGFGQQLQPPMNVPGQLMSAIPEENCICVPFFQCKNGYLSEAQLSKSQLQQVATLGQHANHLYQAPRSVGPEPQQQASRDLYNIQQPTSSLMSQPQLKAQLAGSGSEQQFVNNIYDQLRQNIENDNLLQQLQQQQQQQQQQQNQNLDQYQPLDERSKSGAQQVANASQSESELLERSLLKSPFAVRRSSGTQRCGIMRTCCRLPPAFNQQQHAARYVPPSLAHRPQPQYQMITPERPLVQAVSSHLQQQQQFNDYQPETSALIPTIQQQQQQFSNFQQPPRPPGSFMAGRCGTRQTLGISGRVQNSQPAPGSESTAEFGEFPSHVAILKRISPGDSLFVCSAVLISNQWLATAAHCVRKHRPDELKVRLGEWDVSRDDEFYPFVESNIREIIVHPQFQPSSLINDIALIRMDTTIDPQQMPHITPSCLATPVENFSQQRCWLTGWGKDAFGQHGTFQSVLKKVDLPVIGRQDCETALRYQTKLGKFFRLHQSAICAGGERGKDACEGDGGAGLYCTDPESGLTKAIGLVSWGVGCGQVGVPGVYTNLGAFYSWIEQVVAASGEESIYNALSDRNAPLEVNNFKNIISERSNAPVNATISQETSSRSINGTLVSAADSQSAEVTEKTLTNDDANKELESRAG